MSCAACSISSKAWEGSMRSEKRTSRAILGVDSASTSERSKVPGSTPLATVKSSARVFASSL